MAQPSDRPGDPSGNGVEPDLVFGSPSCTDQGYRFGFQVQQVPPNNGTFTLERRNGTLSPSDAPEDPDNSVTISNSDGSHFDWSASLGIDAVIVVGGPNSNVFAYTTEATGDTQLHAPVMQNGSLRKVQWITFCYDYEVTVTKTAETSFTRTWEWEIEKTVEPAQWELRDGDSGTSEYTVKVTRTGYTDSDWKVSGTITVANDTPFDATITSVTDEISPNIEATVDCGVSFPYVLAAGHTLDCTYAASLPDGTSRMNTATATTAKNGIVDSGEGQAEVVFGPPTDEVNATVDVTDTNGMRWQFDDSGQQNYSRTFTCPDDGGTNPNVATIVETGQSDDASVDVTCLSPPSELFCLWPPNKKYLVMNQQDFQQYVDESCGPVSAWTFDSCTSDQSGGGCSIIQNGTALCVQADRDGGDKNGRRYTVKVKSTPPCGTVGWILVPLDQRNHPNCRRATAKQCP